ncbi:MAG TPA: helix-turn-helix transcriptional regulator [Edaphobacter sp.]|nr:helix-turn-helix transcriptional regulator [Edaphobacter sp.]
MKETFQSRDQVCVLFGARIRQLRKRRGLSQEALAHLAQLDRTYMGGVERGERNPSLLNIHKIALALGTTLPILFSDWANDDTPL